MTGTTTGQTSLATCTDSDDTENFLTVPLTTNLQALANLFESSTGHDHSGSGKGKPIGTAGIASGVTLTSPHLVSPVVDSGGLTITAGGLTVTAGGLGVTSGVTSLQRLKVAGTALVTGDFALSAGWGSTASVTSIVTGSNDQRGQIVVSSSGSGIAGNPTVTFTFHDGTFTTNAFYAVTNIDNTGAVVGMALSLTPTSLSITFYGTPVSGRTYTFTWVGLA